MLLLAAGLNHTTADLALRERVSLSGENLEAALRALQQQEGVREIALLSTCNRTEIYALAEGEPVDLVGWLAKWQQLPEELLRPAMYQLEDLDALRHMMKVAGGLDSLVLGEPQILGQMRDAFANAQQLGVLGNELGRHFQQVFSTAKRIRTETGIGSHPVSVAYAAVSLARHIFADLSKSRVLLIGAGEMITLVARHLYEQRVANIVVANRTLERGEAIADEVRGQAILLEELPRHLESVDIVITCTASPLPILGKGMVERALKKRRHRPIFMVDIAVPRDVEPEVGKLNDVYLYTVDDLQETIDSNVRQRQEAAQAAEKLIDESVHRFQREQNALEAVDTLKTWREHNRELAQAELARAQAQLENGQPASEVLQRFQHALMNKLMHQPSVALKRFAEEKNYSALESARQLLLGDASNDDN